MIMFVMGRFIGLRKGMRRRCKSFSLYLSLFVFGGGVKIFFCLEGFFLYLM